MYLINVGLYVFVWMHFSCRNPNMARKFWFTIFWQSWTILICHLHLTSAMRVSWPFWNSTSQHCTGSFLTLLIRWPNKNPVLWPVQAIWKVKLGLFLGPVLTLWGGGHFYGHVWRRVIVPPDFGGIIRCDLLTVSLLHVLLHDNLNACVIQIHARKATHT